MMFRSVLIFTLLSLFLWVVFVIYGIFSSDVSTNSDKICTPKKDMSLSKSESWQKVFEIFENNIKIIISNFFAFISLGLIVLLNISISGFVLGQFMGFAFNLSLPIPRVLFATMIHFPEPLAISISAGFGLYTITIPWKLKKNKISKRQVLFDGVFLFIICEVLTFIGAILEVFCATKAFII